MKFNNKRPNCTLIGVALVVSIFFAINEAHAELDNTLETAPGKKPRYQELKEYTFKWKNGYTFNMLEVAEMMGKCAGTGIFLRDYKNIIMNTNLVESKRIIYDVTNSLNKKGGAPLQKKIAKGVEEQYGIIVQLLGKKQAEKNVSLSLTFANARVSNQGAAMAVVEEAANCIETTTVVNDMMKTHGKRFPSID